MTKKISLFLLVPVLIPGFLFPSFLGWSLPLQAQESESIFISEIFYTGSLASNQCKSIATEQISNMCSYDKWLEIYNPGSEAVNLKGWRVVVQGSLSEILGEVSVPAESFLVFSNNDYKRSLKGEVEQSSQSFSSSSQISVQNNSQASSQNTQVSSQNNSQNSQSQQASSQTVQSTNSSTNFAQNPSSLVSTSFSSSAPASINSLISANLSLATSQAPTISFSNNQLNPQTNLPESSNFVPKILENPQTELKVKPGNELKNQVLEDKAQLQAQESPVSTTPSILPSLETGKAGPETLEPTSKPQLTAKNVQETMVSLNSTLTQAGIANYSLGILHSLSPSSPLVEMRNNLGQTVARRSYANSTTQGKSRHSVEFDSSQSGGRKAEVSYFGENYGTPGFGFIQKKPQKPEPVTEPVVVTDPVKSVVNAQPSPVIQTQPITETVPQTAKALESNLQTQTEVQPQTQLQTAPSTLPAVQTVTHTQTVTNLQTSLVAQAQVSPALAKQLQLQTDPDLATQTQTQVQTQNALQLQQKPVSSPQSLPEKITQPAAEIAQKQELFASNLDSVSVENLVKNSDLQTNPQANYKPIFVQAAAGIYSLEQSLDAQKWSVFRPKMSLTQSEAVQIQTSQYYPALVQARRLVLPEIISFDSYSSLVLNFLLLLLLLAKRSKKTRELTNFENQPIKLGLKYFQPS